MSPAHSNAGSTADDSFGSTAAPQSVDSSLGEHGASDSNDESMLGTDNADASLEQSVASLDESAPSLNDSADSHHTTPLVMNMQAREVPPFVCTTLSVLTTFPIFYAICMGNHRIIMVK